MQRGLRVDARFSNMAAVVAAFGQFVIAGMIEAMPVRVCFRRGGLLLVEHDLFHNLVEQSRREFLPGLHRFAAATDDDVA